MPGEPREALLRRVRAALGGETAAPPPPPAIDEAVARIVPAESGADVLLERFEQAATRQGLRVSRVTRDTLRGRLEQIVELHAVRRVTLAAADDEPGRLLERLLADLGLTIVQPDSADPESTADSERRTGDPADSSECGTGVPAGAPPAPRAPRPAPAPQSHHYTVDAGITDCRAAIAESGTLIYRTDPRHDRGAPCVPPRHIALLPASQILPDLLDAAPLIAPAGDDAPSSTLLITGPSKTADIEGVLVTGIHGPTEVDVLLVEDA